MKKHIIHILQTHISAIQMCNDDDTIEIVGINTAADEIIKIADKMVSERLREELIKYDKWCEKQSTAQIILLSSDELVSSYLNSRLKGGEK